jgi:hypothetical protein
MEHYADCFYMEQGRYWRMMTCSEPGRQGAPTHCPGRVEWRGRMKDNAGKWHTVWTCDGHADDDIDWRRVGMVAS